MDASRQSEDLEASRYKELMDLLFTERGKVAKQLKNELEENGNQREGRSSEQTKRIEELTDVLENLNMLIDETYKANWNSENLTEEILTLQNQLMETKANQIKPEGKRILPKENQDYKTELKTVKAKFAYVEQRLEILNEHVGNLTRENQTNQEELRNVVNRHARKLQEMKQQANDREQHLMKDYQELRLEVEENEQKREKLTTAIGSFKQRMNIELRHIKELMKQIADRMQNKEKYPAWKIWLRVALVNASAGIIVKLSPRLGVLELSLGTGVWTAAMIKAIFPEATLSDVTEFIKALSIW